MSRILCIGDVHLSDTPPSRRSETYTEDILAKLEWLVEQAEVREVDAMCQLGDLFHLKSASRNSHRLVQRIHNVLTEYGRSVVLTIGNHDIVGDRTDSLDSQPLGSLGRMGDITVLVGQHEYLPVFAIPYLQDWQTLPHWIEQYRQARGADTTSTWLLTMHAPIFPDHIDPPYESIAASDLADMIGDLPTHVAYGHIHDPHGIYKPRAGLPVTLGNLGAVSRGSLHAETLKRSPQAYVYDTETEDVEVLDIPHRPVEEIFPLQDVNAEKAKAAGMTAFLEGIGSDVVDATDVDSVMAAARDAELGSEVEEIVLSLLTTDE